jgi:tol-pal system protein YbgF
MKRVLSASAAVLVLALAGTPAHAQLFGGKRQDEAIAAMQARIAELQDAHRKLEGELRAVTEAHNNTRGELTAASARLDDMLAANRTVNGTAEALAAELASTRRDLQAAQAQNRDLVDRITRVESGLAAMTVAAASPVAATPAAATTATPAQAFAAARALMDAGRFAEAGDAFEAYVAAHGSQPNAPEANYWLGETLFVQENYADAAQAYIAALKGWPKSSWAPDALVKLSSSLVRLQQPAEACKTLGELTRRYPNASNPVKARAQTTRTQAKCRG